MDKQTAKTLLKVARELGYIATANPTTHAPMGEPPLPRATRKPGPIHTPTPRVAQDLETLHASASAWRDVTGQLLKCLRISSKDAARQHRADCRTLETTLENLDAASPAAEDCDDDYDTETPFNPVACTLEEYLCEQGQWATCDEATAFADLIMSLEEISDHADTVLGSIDTIRTAQDKRLILTQRHG